jgi:hypothetical protein
MEHLLQINCALDSKGKSQGQQLWARLECMPLWSSASRLAGPSRLLKNHFGIAALLDTREMKKQSNVRSLSCEKGQEKYSQNPLPSFCG